MANVFVSVSVETLVSLALLGGMGFVALVGLAALWLCSLAKVGSLESDLRCAKIREEGLESRLALVRAESEKWFSKYMAK